MPPPSKNRKSQKEKKRHEKTHFDSSSMLYLFSSFFLCVNHSSNLYQTKNGNWYVYPKTIALCCMRVCVVEKFLFSLFLQTYIKPKPMLYTTFLYSLDFHRCFIHKFTCIIQTVYIYVRLRFID